MSCSVQIKSRNTVKIKKVNNVVHRTTSETLRLNEPEVWTNNTSRQALSAISPSNLKKSSCSFQITGVSLTQRTDVGDDSADDLDESHTDDISRVTDNETPSFSEDTCSRDTEDNIVDSCSALCSVTVIPTVPEFELENILSAETSFITTADFSETSIDRFTYLGDMASNPPTTTKNQRFPGTRFTVVKIETGIPVRRGRWECLDYIDNSVYTPKHALTYNSPTTSDLSSTNTQPHYTMTPTTPTSNPMQINFAALGTNYIDTVNKLLQSLSPRIQGMTQAMLASSTAPHFPLDSPLANRQLSPGAAVPPSLFSPTQQDYTALLSNLLTAQMSKTATNQQSTTLPLVNPQLSNQFLNQTSGYASQDSIQTLQSQPSMYASPTHGPVSATQIPQTFVQPLYSSPSYPVNISTTIGSETLIRNQVSGYSLQPSTSLNQGLSVQRNIQSQPIINSSSQIQGVVQQQMIYPSPTLGSALPQNSAALITSNQGSPLPQQNVQINPTAYSTPPNQIQASRYAPPGQVQQQMIYSSPTLGSVLPQQSPALITSNQGSPLPQQNVQINPTAYSTPPNQIQASRYAPPGQVQQQMIYSSPTLGSVLPQQSPALITSNQGSPSPQQNVQINPTAYSTPPNQIQASRYAPPGQVQQQMVYSSPTLGSALPQHSAALITSNQGSPLPQQNVQINPTVYSTPPNQIQASRYAPPGQVQQQMIHSSPTLGSALPQHSVALITSNQGSPLPQQNVQINPTVYSTPPNQIQTSRYAPPGQVQQQMIHSSPTLGSALPQHSAALITSSQGSPLPQQNVQINPTVYSTPPNQNQASRYASPGQVQQQPMYSTPPAFSQPAAPVSQTLYPTQSPSFTSPVQGSAPITQFRSESQATPLQLQGGVQSQNSGLYSTQPQIPLQPTSYSTQSQGAIDYVAQAKQIILQLQSQSQIQLQNTTYSTTLASQASLPALGQTSSYVQQPQVQTCASTYSAPQIQRQISAPPVYNQSSTYPPQQSNINYSSPQVLSYIANLMSQISNQPQVPNQSSSFVSLPQNQTNLQSQPSTNYLFQTSAASQDYLHVVQSQPSNYIYQPFTQASTSGGTVSQTSANQVQSEAQQNYQFRRSLLSNDPHHSFSGPQTSDPLSDPFVPSHLRHYSSNVLQSSCSVIQLHKQGQPASYVALPQEHGAYILHHVPSLSVAVTRKSVSAHQSRLHTQTSVHSFLPPRTEKSSTYVHQPGPTHNLTHQVSAQKRRLVGQTLNFTLEPQVQSADLDSHSSIFAFHNRPMCSTYSKVKDPSKVAPHKAIFLPYDSTTVTASIIKPIASGSVTPVKTPHEKSATEGNFSDKLKHLDLSHSSTTEVVEKLEQVLDAGATVSDIAAMELKPAANNTSAIIDTKIEQAMDLVKSHLLYTVREEVEVLKLRISELLTRINQLEKENSFLKANATPEVLTALNTRSEEVQTDETSFPTDAAPQGDATVPAVPIE